VFHSISAVSALRQATEVNAFAALVLFDPPFCPSGGLPRDMENVGMRLAQGARRRRARFEDLAEFASHLSSNPAFERVNPGVIDLIARTTLRRCDDGMSWELCCPREYEAQIYEYVYCWAVIADFERITCPMKAIGADPTVMNSYLPSIDIRDLALVNYDFVPDTTHLMQLEKPEVCVHLATQFLDAQGLA
jgi:pimeloyl-ACP methyl ester carboxylesterase